MALYDRLNPWSADNDYYRAFAAGGESLLDLGCGTGRLAAAIAADGKAVVGVDPSGAMLAAETVHGDWSGTPFTESSREIIIVARRA